MRSRVLTATVIATAVLGVAVPSAASDGLPIPVDQAYGDGVVSADGHSRFVAIGAGEKTVVMRIETGGGTVVDYTTTDGTFGVPAVALDATASGISADGETLALINPRERFPRTSTDLQVYEAQKLRRGPVNIHLDGDFSFDALSPNGETMYLVEYPDRRDPGAYQVRAFDLATRELDPDPILDTEEEPGEMRGFPQTRVTSQDGGWAYTLYDGGEHPFIHALDLVNATTVCIDLDMISARQTYGATLAMSADGDAIEVTDRKGTLKAVVNTATHEATEPDDEPEPTATPVEEDSGAEMAGIAAGALVLMAIAAVGIRRMRR